MRVSILIAALILSFSSEATERHALELSFCSPNTNCSECVETVGITLLRHNHSLELQAKAPAGGDIKEPLDKCVFITVDDFVCDLGRIKIARRNGTFSAQMTNRLNPQQNNLEACLREV